MVLSIVALVASQTGSSAGDVIFDWFGWALALIMDGISWFPRLVGGDSWMSIQDPLIRVGGVFLGISISWLVVALTLHLCLRYLAVQVALHAPTLTRSLSLAQTVRTVRAAVGMYLALKVGASWFGRSGYSPDPGPDPLLRMRVHLKGRRALATGASLLLRAPYTAGRFIAALGQLLTNRFLWLFALATWWYLYRPPEAAWTALPQQINQVIITFSPSVAAAWITVLTALIAVFFISVRWRGRTAWRVSRYEQAHAALDGLSLTAARAQNSLDELIDIRAHEVPPVLIRAVEDLTHGGCYWDDADRTLTPWMHSFSRYRGLHPRPGRTADDGASVRQALNALSTKYHDSVEQGVRQELWKIASRRARSALFELRFRASSNLAPWSTDLSLLNEDWAHRRIQQFVSDHSQLVEQFGDITHTTDIPDDLLESATLAIRQFADELHDEISKAIWVSAELADLAGASRRYLFPSPINRFFDAVRARS